MLIAFVASGYLFEDDDTSLLQTSDLVLAVDGGLNHCHKMGIVPSIIVGDFDSVRPQVLDLYPNIKRISYSRDKNQTDLELALAEFMTENCQGILFGALGLRTDHMLANLHLLRRYPHRLTMIGAGQSIVAIEGDGELNCAPGQTVSLIPIGGAVSGITTRGLRWELQNGTLDPDFLSVSNECIDSKFHYSIAQGSLLCIRTGILL